MEHLREQLERFRESFLKAEELWNNYYTFVKTTVREWEAFKIDLLDRLSEVRVKLEADLRTTEELSLKLDLGLLSEEKVKKKLDELQEEIARLKEEYQTLWLAYEEITLMYITHCVKSGLPVSLSAGDIEEKKEELKSAVNKKMVSEEVAQQLEKILSDEASMLLHLHEKG
jgi:archaellum component FlaC